MIDPTAQLIAMLLVLCAAGWLMGVAVLCAAKPERARDGLARMGSSWRFQLGELIPRAIAGGAMVLRAPYAKVPLTFEIAGWFILATSVLILLVPMRWHNAYARWWAQRIPLGAYRVFALPTVGLGVLLAYAAF